MANHLEQLIAEWYEYQGYFIRQNVKVGKRLRGGYECELDIVGFHPQEHHLIHLEPSLDADSWAVREERYRKKFEAGRKYIPSIFEGLSIPTDVEQVAIFYFGSKKNHETIAGGKVKLVPELLREICAQLKTKSLDANAIDEQKPLLRTLHYAVEYRNILLNL